MTSNISFKSMLKSGSTIIKGGDSYNGLLYSEDNGKTWNESNINTDRFKCLTVVGNTVIAGSYSRNKDRGLYYSEDNGKTWIQSNINSGRFWCLLTDGSKVFASGSYNTKDCLLYSEDNGHTWNSLYKYDYINIELYRKRKDKN